MKDFGQFVKVVALQFVTILLKMKGFGFFDIHLGFHLNSRFIWFSSELSSGDLPLFLQQIVKVGRAWP